MFLCIKIYALALQKSMADTHFCVSRSENEENARSRTVTERISRKIFENYKNFSYNIYVRKINYNKKRRIFYVYKE